MLEVVHPGIFRRDVSDRMLDSGVRDATDIQPKRSATIFLELNFDQVVAIVSAPAQTPAWKGGSNLAATFCGRYVNDRKACMLECWHQAPPQHVDQLFTSSAHHQEVGRDGAVLPVLFSIDGLRNIQTRPAIARNDVFPSLRGDVGGLLLELE